MPNVVEKKTYICVNFKDGKNNNKFWRYILNDDDSTFVEWGRVLDDGSGGLKVQGSQHATRSKTMAKMRSKTNPNNKPDKIYTEVKVAEGVTSVSSATVASSSLKAIIKRDVDIKDPIVKDLWDMLEKENVHDIVQASGGSISYDASSATFKTPLGVIMPEQVSDARDVLDKIAPYVVDNKYSSVVFSRLLEKYLRLVPHNIGRKRPSPELIFPDAQALQNENNLLDGLTVSFNDIQSGAAAAVGKKAKKVVQPKLFDVTLDVVRDRAIISRINTYYERTKKTMHQSHRYKLHKVYEIEIKSVKKNFASIGQNLGNIQELFHGTKCSNLLAILKKGLIIPPARSGHVTGRLGGDGIYGSDISSKALNYAGGYAPGQNRCGSTRRIFMILCDFAMGKVYKSKGYGDYRTLKQGYDSTFMEGGKHGLYNNEMIVYRTGQVDLKYLLEFE